MSSKKRKVDNGDGESDNDGEKTMKNVGETVAEKNSDSAAPANKKSRKENGDEAVETKAESDIEEAGKNAAVIPDTTTEKESAARDKEKAVVHDNGEAESTPAAACGGDQGAAAEKLNDNDSALTVKAPGTSGCGVLLYCGTTTWDNIGRKVKGAKGSCERNLLGPHRLQALAGIRVRLAVSSSSACHNVLITDTGRVMTWGRNEKGQLGLGDTKRRDSPTYIESLMSATAVDAACGRSHTLLITEDGHVMSFGDNKLGQCGIGSQTSGVLVPYQIPFKGRPIAKVACGAEFSMIVDVKGSVFSFGCPEYGQLGHNTDGRYFITSNKLAFRCEILPRRVNLFVEKSREGHVIPMEDVHIVAIACGTNHTVAMDTKKRCYSWGFGGYGRLGHSEPKDEMIPRLIKFFDGPNRGVINVSAGSTYSMAVNEHSCLYFWGQTKMAGDATMYPKPIHDLTGWKVRCMGCSNKSVVVLADDSVISWGPSPTYGELGYGESKPKSSTTPQEVKLLDGIHIHAVSCGFAQTLFVARDETDDDQARLNKLPEFSG